MLFHEYPKYFFFLTSFFLIRAGFATNVDRMAIISNIQSTPINTCSEVLTVQAQDSNSIPTIVTKNTAIFFTGSSKSLKFYLDPNCLHSISKLTMKAKTHSENFYYKGDATGSYKIIVATYKYVDGQKYVSIPSSVTPTPIPPIRPTPGGDLVGRKIPEPIYGVTLDRVDNSIIGDIVQSLQKMAYTPTSRVVFDLTAAASYYSTQLPKIYNSSYIMGQILDSTDMAKVTVNQYQQRAQNYVQTLGKQVDIWEIGNEVNGNWLGTNTEAKILAAYNVVAANQGVTALTFFYEGGPNDPNNCLDGPGNDMFTWINKMFQLNLESNQRELETEKLRLNLNYALISWYPDGCPGQNPDWVTVFSKLSEIFPNAKVGFGEIGTTTVQNGSNYEINLINQFYSKAWTNEMPSQYIGGYFWWNFVEEMVPYTKNLFNVLNNAIIH
jgi:hypothetical protein